MATRGSRSGATAAARSSAGSGSSIPSRPGRPDASRSRGGARQPPRTGGNRACRGAPSGGERAAEEQRRTLAQVGEALIAAKRAAGRKPSTIEAYSYWLRIHIVDFFGPTPVGEITRDDVRAFGAALERKGLAPKPRANALGTLHSLIEFAIDEGWMVGENPVKRVEKPALAEADPDVRFLETEEVEALLRAVPDDPLG
jgi:integrase